MILPRRRRASSWTVDAAVKVLTYPQWERLQSRLRECGVVVRGNPAVGKGRICLFDLDEIEVDIMPVRLPLILPPSRDAGTWFAIRRATPTGGRS
jgi:hypothetical protein